MSKSGSGGIRLSIVVMLWTLQCLSTLAFADINLAIGRPAMGSVANPELTVDGVTSALKGCANRRGKAFVMVDLGAVVDVQAVRVWDRPDTRTIRDVQVRVHRTFSPCDEDAWQGGSPCGVIDPTGGSLPALVQCSVRGQYVSVSKASTRRWSYAYFCEIEVFGKVVPEISPILAPRLPQLRGTVSSSNLRRHILGGLDNVKVDIYSGPIAAVGLNAEALLTKPKSRVCVLAASSFGKGRVVASGMTEIVQRRRLCAAGIVQPWPRVIRWLSYGKPARCYSPQDVVARSAEFAKPGGVITWIPQHEVSAEAAAAVRKVLRAGKAGLLIAVKSWWRSAKPLSEYRGYELLRDAGLDAPKGVATWSQETWGISARKITRLSTMQLVRLMAVNTWAFLTHYDILTTDFRRDTLEEMDAQRLGKAMARHFRPFAAAHAPCPNRPVVASGPERKIGLAFCALMRFQGLAGTGIEAPGARNYPGTSTSSLRQDVSLEIVGDNAKEAHSTGLYLLPGGTLELEPLDEATRAALTNWNVVIGSHSDSISHRKKWSRAPRISVEIRLDRGRVYSGYGGVVWLRNLVAKTRVKLRLRGAIAAPFYNARDAKNTAAWDAAGRHHPAPWAELAGDAVVLTVEAKHVRRLTGAYLRDLLQLWDDLVKQDFHLRGSDWRAVRRQRIVVDVQISVGAGHAGYPIMMMSDWTADMLALEKNKKNLNWGICHEVGHNMVERRWNYKGVGEVVNNVFCLYNRKQLGQTWNHTFEKFPRAFIANHLKNKHTFDHYLSNFFNALAMYCELAELFGFTIYKKAFRYYTAHNLNPRTNKEKLQTWIEVLSKSCRFNLSPLFEFWGLPVSGATKAKLKALTAFLPDDVYVKMAPKRSAEVLSRWPGAARNATKLEDKWEAEKSSFNEMSANDVILL